MYNLNYAPTTLGVQSWVEKCLLEVRGEKRLNTTGLVLRIRSSFQYSGDAIRLYKL
jgi:hypothetical protein